MLACGAGNAPGTFRAACRVATVSLVMHVEHTTEVEQTIDAVYAFLLDGSKDPRWRPGIVEIRQIAGTGPGVGLAYAQTLKGPGGRRIAGDFRFTRCESPTLLAFEVIAGPVRPKGVFTLRSLNAGRTEVTFAMDVEPTGVMRMLSGAVRKQALAEVQSIARLSEAMLQG